MSGSGMKSAAFSVALHAAAIAVAFFLSAKTKGEPVVSAADPLLAILAEQDADPTKDAGLKDAERGIADGSPDGTELGAPEENALGAGLEDLGDLIRESEEILNAPLPEPEPAPVPAKQDVPAKPAAPEAPKKTPPAPAKKPEKTATKTDAGSAKPMSFDDWKKKRNSGGGKKTPPKKPGKGGGGKPVKAPQIDTTGITGNGGGSGRRFGAPGGTGGNGGDGGSAVASARQAYVAELEKRLAAHLDGVLTQTPLKLDAAVVVKVSLGVDSRGNVRLLDVHGASDPQVRDRVAKAVARLGKFRAPPEGKAFEILIPRVELRPQ